MVVIIALIVTLAIVSYHKESKRYAEEQRLAMYCDELMQILHNK